MSCQSDNKLQMEAVAHRHPDPGVCECASRIYALTFLSLICALTGCMLKTQLEGRRRP